MDRHGGYKDQAMASTKPNKLDPEDVDLRRRAWLQLHGEGTLVHTALTILHSYQDSSRRTTWAAKTCVVERGHSRISQNGFPQSRAEGATNLGVGEDPDQQNIRLACCKREVPNLPCQRNHTRILACSIQSKVPCNSPQPVASVASPIPLVSSVRTVCGIKRRSRVHLGPQVPAVNFPSSQPI